jgi:site-specific DNA recombinase
MKDRDHGRDRIHCSTMREAGSYIDQIETAVLSGLQQHLKAPHLLKEFARTYQEERERLAGEKLRRRSQIESQLGQLQRSIDRRWADYESERVPVDIAGPKLKDMQDQKVACRLGLPSSRRWRGLLAFHSAAVRHYEEHVTRLQSVFGEGVTPAGNCREDPRPFRPVTVHAREDGFSIELHGRLALLMGAPNLYPNMRIAGSGGVRPET